MLRVHHDAGVTTLTLARPDRGNALSADLVESLLTQVQSAAQEPMTHTLLLRGEGRHFCTGLDLSDLDTCTDASLLLRLVRIETLLAALWHAPLRTVVLAEGRTWGAGADLFAACEQRLAQPGATFRFPGAQFGIVLGTRRLAERVGVDAARAVVTEGREWDLTAAIKGGLCSAELDDDELDDSLAEACQPPQVDRATAAAVRAATRADHRDADLAELVRSAAEPGLVQRVQAYRARLKAG
jgi:enoyl-CoA hydratase/carnithine racemase